MISVLYQKIVKQINAVMDIISNNFTCIFVTIHTIYCVLLEMERERFLSFIDWIDDDTMFTGVMEVLALPRFLILVERIARWFLAVIVITVIAFYPTWMNALLSIFIMQHIALLKIVVQKCVVAGAFPGKIVSLQKYQTCTLGVAMVWLLVALVRVDVVMRLHMMDYVVSLSFFLVIYMTTMVVHLGAVWCVYVRKLNSKNNTSPW